MKSSRVFTIASVKVLALIAAIVVVPVLAYLGLKGNGGENSGKGYSGKGTNGNGDYGVGKHIAVVPEANAGWVLVPFFGAVLLFSSRQLFRGKAAENNAH